MSNKDLELEIKKFVKWSKKIGKYGLIRCSSGNLSHRLSDGTILVSQTQSWLGELSNKQVVHFDLVDHKVIDGGKPTGELQLHTAVLKRNPEVYTVLHFQSLAATTLACRPLKEVNYNVIIEIPIYIGNVIQLPFLMPGTNELANAVAEAAASASVIQLQNHGQVVVGKSYKDTFQKAVFFELACNIILQSENKMNYITSEQINMLSNYRK